MAPRSNDPHFMGMHDYPSWVVHRHKLVTLALIPLTCSIHKNLKVKVMAPRSKATGPKFHAHAHLPFMGSPHEQTFVFQGPNYIVEGVLTFFYSF